MRCSSFAKCSSLEKKVGKAHTVSLSIYIILLELHVWIYDQLNKNSSWKIWRIFWLKKNNYCYKRRVSWMIYWWIYSFLSLHETIAQVAWPLSSQVWGLLLDCGVSGLLLEAARASFSLWSHHGSWLCTGFLPLGPACSRCWGALQPLKLQTCPQWDSKLEEDILKKVPGRQIHLGGEWAILCLLWSQPAWVWTLLLTSLCGLVPGTLFLWAAFPHLQRETIATIAYFIEGQTEWKP